MKISFNTALQKFNTKGEKTGWTYIEVPADLAEKLKPGQKQSFRVKGKLDTYKIEQVALIPMGGGSFIMAVNATMRKGIGKKHGAMVKVELTCDDREMPLSSDFMSCLEDEPSALRYFQTLPKGHQKYFSQWIESAKTEATKTKRIALAVNALSRNMGYGEMIREDKANRQSLL
ncbi:MAG: DUF1905 domain-containing protein [Chitinophagales bacterium]|nr:DUF1905 domain-containing protein [Chitinophagales bacterium]